MNLRHLIKYKFLLKHHHVTQNSRAFVLPYGLGDTYLICSLLAEFKRKYSVDDLLLIVKPGHEAVIKMFKLSVRTIVARNMSEIVYIVGQYGKNINGHIYIAHPNYISESSLTSFIGYKDFNLADMYKVMLGLSPEINLISPKSPKKVAESHFRSIGLVKNKSIILFPEATSIDFIRREFWEDIAKFYVKLGYSIFSSVSNPKNQIAGTLLVSIPLTQIREATSYAGYVISLRSGICEVISTSKAKIMIIYPDFNWYSGPFITGSSLVKMGLSTNITEVVVDNKTKISSLQLRQFVNEQ